MEDQPSSLQYRRPSPVSGPFTDWQCRAVFGAMAAGLFGAVAGAAVGFYNEATLTGDEYEELSLGFAEYTAYGMAYLVGLMAALYGGVAGAIAAAGACVSRRRWVGVAAGVTASLFTLLFWPEWF